MLCGILARASYDFSHPLSFRIVYIIIVVIREMAVLQLLSHPGIARLVSSFRYTASAYMVLEYAGAGDLHSYVLSKGPLKHLSVRFIVGEIAAAVISVHDLGFSYGKCVRVYTDNNTDISVLVLLDCLAVIKEQATVVNK
jgi:serine/threonine protein kinase